MKDGKLSGYCSGSLIAPRVVLTAGHCVVDFSEWKITAPYAGGASSSAREGSVYDYPHDHAGSIDWGAHDIGLIFMETPITLDRYPSLAKAGVEDKTEVVSFGRTTFWTTSSTNIFMSRPFEAGNDWAGTSYYGDNVLYAGDSGGGVELADHEGAPVIVGVNSATNAAGVERIARVDVVGDWIAQQLAAHR